MFSDLKPYPERAPHSSRDSDLIPCHWTERRLKSLARLNPSRSEVSHEIESGAEATFLPMEAVSSSGRVDYSRRIEPLMTTAGFTYFRGRDVLVAKITPCFENGKGACLEDLPTKIGFGSTEFHVLRAGKEVTPKFLEAVTRSRRFRQLGANAMTGSAGQQRVPTEFVGCYSVALPPRTEQDLLVRFLGHANARIGRAIEAKRKMIALLDEQKRVSLNLIVTHGTGPPTDFRDNGFLCLDTVPLHWETPRLARCLTRVEQGWSPAAAEGALRDDQWAVLTLSAVQRGQFNRYALKPIPVGESVPTQMETSDGDLLLTRSNTRDRVGDVAVVRGVRPKTIISDLIYRLIVDPKMLKTEFLCLVLLSELGRSQIMRDARGSSGTMPKIAQSHIGSWRIVMPPLSEQDRICAEVDEDSRRADVARLRLEQETELLSEFGTRLTSDVVTGQLDVRKAAAELPDLDPADLAGEDIEDIDAVAEEFLDGDEP